MRKTKKQLRFLHAQKNGISSTEIQPSLETGKIRFKELETTFHASVNIPPLNIGGGVKAKFVRLPK